MQLLQLVGYFTNRLMSKRHTTHCSMVFQIPNYRGGKRREEVIDRPATWEEVTFKCVPLQEGAACRRGTLSVLTHGYSQCSCRKGLNYRSMPTPDPPKIESNMVRAHTALSTPF